MTTWTKEPLGNVLSNIKTGSTPRTSHQEYFNGNIPWFTPSDIGKTKALVKSSRTISEDGIKNGGAKLFGKGTLLVTCIGEIGRVGVLGRQSSANQQITALIFDETICPDFAYYWFVANRHKLERLTNQSVLPILNNERLREVQFSFPASKEEQKRIVDILDKADRLRCLRRFARGLTERLVQAIFFEMFGDLTTNPHSWDMATIDDVIAFSQYGTSEKNNHGKRGYPVLGMSNISYSGTLLLDSLSYVELDADEFEKLRLVPGDIIFNRTNSTELVGKTACWNRSMNAVLASYLVKLRLKNNMLPEYFVALLNTAHFKKVFQDRCKKAVGQSNISPTLLKEFPVYVPPPPLQEKFVAVVRRVERLLALQREADRQTEHFFRTLLHRVFAENA